MYEAYHEPDNVCCCRTVANDLIVSPWYEMPELGSKPTMDEFLTKLDERSGLCKDKMCIRAYRSGKGIIIDWGLRLQFWIPDPEGWDLTELEMKIEDRLDKKKNEIKLLPCPFCGSKAVINFAQEIVAYGDEGYFIQCENVEECGFNTAGVNGNYSNSIQSVVKRWNRRVGREKEDAGCI